MLRRDFLTRQRDWEAELARSAPIAPAASDDEDMDMDEGGIIAQEQSRCPIFALSGTETPLMLSAGANNMMEEVLSHEEQELEALVSLMEVRETTAKHQEGATAGCGSEEDDYDRLFMEVLEQPERTQSINTSRAAPDNDAEMDISVG